MMLRHWHIVRLTSFLCVFFLSVFSFLILHLLRIKLYIRYIRYMISCSHAISLHCRALLFAKLSSKSSVLSCLAASFSMASRAKPSSLFCEMADLRSLLFSVSQRNVLHLTQWLAIQWTMYMQLPGPKPMTESRNHSLTWVNLVWILKQRFPCWIRAGMIAILTQN